MPWPLDVLTRPLILTMAAVGVKVEYFQKPDVITTPGPLIAGPAADCPEVVATELEPFEADPPPPATVAWVIVKPPPVCPQTPTDNKVENIVRTNSLFRISRFFLLQISRVKPNPYGQVTAVKTIAPALLIESCLHVAPPDDLRMIP